KKRGWSVPIVASNEVHQYVENLALSLSEKPVISLGLLKRHLGRDLEKQVAGLKQVNTFKAEDEFTGSDNVVTTRSKYIELESPIEGVLTIRIATGDKNYKLKTLISGLEDILNQLENTSAYKV
uniref:hypothetical protein n=1 Tax=Aquimarina megaterium TaxID=1443666 RepID=UPI000550A3C8